MAKIYARLIENGKMPLEEVPARWRETVAEMLTEAESEG